MYHAFNHNIRTRDHERNERIRKQFREKYAIFKRENAERERLAAEQAAFERAKSEPEQTAAQTKIESRPVPESPFEAAKRIAAEWEKRAYEQVRYKPEQTNAEPARSEHAESKRTKTESGTVPVERTGPVPDENELERIRREAKERRDRLVALAEQRKRESPGGLDR